ncbi:3-hydroxyacyl-CoA dehydrogenase family protein [Risungbinella massiliensis]|uniref:3-hydroxyacyl-CoA dehydrogenase family protein n=1 Tax=Risungbinella massiliensis TaxID=1329796 RepID=UPI000AAA01F1|nr:3-hydroxyacyl-CoA dehydrogenase NAD-binding domain-containing protein [Risungbinella massiliensis]
MSSIQHIVILGGGTMGQGITELVASKGFDATLIETTEMNIAAARQEIERSLDRKLAKWGITPAERKSTLSRIRFSTDKSLLAEADFVIETVSEDLELKKDLFAYCDQICRPEVLFASNTSTLSLTEIAASTNRAEQVIGLHFVYPVTKRPVVEIVRGLKTSEETMSKVKELLPLLQLESVEVYESPGFVTTRLMMLLVNEALYTLTEGVATAEEIDRAMKVGYHFHTGPLEMADRFGLDSVLAALERLFREFGDTKFRPAPILKKMVRAGHLGMKTGEGIFRYNKEGDRLTGKGAIE